MLFHWSLIDCKSPRASKTLLSILANLKIAVIWMVSTRPFISMFSYPGTNPFMTVTSAPIAIGIIVTFMFHSFSCCLTRSLFAFFQFYPDFDRNGKVDYSGYSIFVFLTITSSRLLAKIRWSVCISKSLRSLCLSFSRTYSRMCIHHLFVWSNLYFFLNPMG